MTLWLGALNVSGHTTEFGDHRHCGSGDITVLL